MSNNLNTKTMKKTIAILGFVLMGSLVVASPPKKVNLTFNKAAKELTIQTIHKTKDVNKHFIKTLKITVNGTERDVVELKKQTSLTETLYVYKMEDLFNGDLCRF